MAVNKVLVGSLVGAGAVVMLGMGAVHSVNNMTSQEQTAESQLSNIQIALQRRHDLIPNLVSSVAGSQKQEQKVYGQIADARTQYYNANKSYKNADTAEEKTQALEKQESALNVMVGSIKENYPDLKSNQQVSDLMVELEGSENRISVERQKYNNIAKSYNTTVKRFPASILAGMTGHTALHYYQADSSAETAPTVNFDK
jgi:Uncharacterized conserved protein